MESSWLATILVHPFALAILAAVMLASTLGFGTKVRRQDALGYSQLVWGYMGVAVAALIISAASTYISPEDALYKWKVPTDQYWSVIVETFITTSIWTLYFSLMGVAIIGVPIILALARSGLGTTPWVLGTSILISGTAIIFLLQPMSSSLGQLLRGGLTLIGEHLMLTFGFCLAARIPWRTARHHESIE